MPPSLVKSVAAFALTFCGLSSITNDQSSDEHELDNSDSVGSETSAESVVVRDSDNDLGEFLWDH